MNVRTLLRPVRRLWPQKIRTRLTLIYATLFFAAGLGWRCSRSRTGWSPAAFPHGPPLL